MTDPERLERARGAATRASEAFYLALACALGFTVGDLPDAGAWAWVKIAFLVALCAWVAWLTVGARRA